MVTLLAGSSSPGRDSTSDYASLASPSSISALDYCHLSSSSSSSSSLATSLSAASSASSCWLKSSSTVGSSAASSSSRRSLKRQYDVALQENTAGNQQHNLSHSSSSNNNNNNHHHRHHHHHHNHHLHHHHLDKTQDTSSKTPKDSYHHFHHYHNNNNNNNHHHHLYSQEQHLQPFKSSSSSSEHKLHCSVLGRASKHDPVYLEDEAAYRNLLVKEEAELKARRQVAAKLEGEANLDGQQRHALLSWMLDICQHQGCQDDVFPLACAILDKFLLFQPVQLAEPQAEDLAELSLGLQCEEEEELRWRQLHLFAACSLLLAAKLRQTPRLSVQTLIEFSKSWLPIELSREEILEGELLVLSALKWDLAGLVTASDFLVLLLLKCNHLLAAEPSDKQQQAAAGKTVVSQTKNRCDESRVRKHTQDLLDLCLMDAHLSQIQPSILAVASLAVAIDGLSRTEKTCRRLNDIVVQIHEATQQVNELELMIDVAIQIEKYVQKLHSSTQNDD